MKNFTSEITSLIQVLRQCYIERDPENIDRLSDLLFDASAAPVMIGTSDSEWCFTIAEARELFLSDWRDWGNVTLDMPSLTCGETGPLAWFHMKAGVEYRFEENDKRYSSYMDTVKIIAAGGKPPLQKSGEIIWLLSHLLHMRGQDCRKYIWPMTISGVFLHVCGRLKSRTMQFSMPVTAAFPDVRIDGDDGEENRFRQECERIGEFPGFMGARECNQLKAAITSALPSSERRAWICDDTCRYIGTDGIARNGAEFAIYLEQLAARMTIELTPGSMVAERHGDAFCFCGAGIFTRKVSMDDELENVLQNVDSFNRVADKKEALFMLRRDLALALKEASLSNRSVNPFRVEGAGKIVDNRDIVFEYVQFSYPFKWVLEQKTDAPQVC